MRRKATLLLLSLMLVGCGAASTPALRAAHPAAAPVASTASTTPCLTSQVQTHGRLRVRVTLAAPVKEVAVAGHLIVAMTSAADLKNPLAIDWQRVDRMRDVWKAAIDVPSLARGGAVEVDPDLLAWPRAFSKAPPGKYRIAAVLRRAGAPPIHGAVVERTIDPAHAGVIDVPLDTVLRPPPEPRPPAGIDFVSVESKLLSAFYGRPIKMEALVTLPPSYGQDKARRFATEYFVMGFGATPGHVLDHLAVKWRKARADANYPELVRVVLCGNIPSGHHVFADSVNDGPWGRALVEELVPYLERKYALDRKPRARLLSGHSSGGWASLWLQVNYPDFFGGAWATAPDPVDLRNFMTVDVTPGSKDNFFRKRDGQRRGVLRMGGQDVLGFEDMVRLEQIDGEVGGLGSFEWVFSPRGPTGLPMPLFDRATGEQDPAVQRAWERWDIRKVLESRWATLGPKLKAKIHVFVGTEDSFFLNESVALLCDFFTARKSDAVCEMIPGKTHFGMRGDVADPKSLWWRIAREMATAAGIR